MTANKETAIQKAVDAYVLTSGDVDATEAKSALALESLNAARAYAVDGIKVNIQKLIDQATAQLASAQKAFDDAYATAADATAADGAAYAGVQAAMLASKQTGAQESV